MDKKTEALKLALEQLEVFTTTTTYDSEDDEVGRKACCNEVSYRPHAPNCKTVAAITAIKEALAEQPAEQEPVAWRYQDARGHYRYRGYKVGFDKEYRILKPVPLYTSPQPSKPWVGLTDEERREIGHPHFGNVNMSDVAYARVIEAKLREKNA